MTNLLIEGGRVLRPGCLEEGDLALRDGRVAAAIAEDAWRFDAAGLLVLPGMVDLHGDAFERQIQPRPGVGFPLPLALRDTEAQLLANGITTAYLGVTLSWEPGLRGAEGWTALLDALRAARARIACDMRVHLRWEAFNLPAMDLALAGIAAGEVHLLAFNDHTPAILEKLRDPAAGLKYSARAGMAHEAFAALAAEVAARAEEVPAALARLAAAARTAGLPMASHDDGTVAARDGFRALGARICEFPVAEEVGRAAARAGDWVAMGAPNVVRGGSHLGWASAGAMAEAGVCRVLTSDYFYPAMLQAAFAMADRIGFAAAWALVSSNPADAVGLVDRGALLPGRRADVALVAPGPAPRVVATLCGGRIAHMTAEGAGRLRAGAGALTPA